MKLLFGLRAEAPDRQIAVQEDHRYVCRRLDVDQVAVETIELGVTNRHFLVDSRELFVR